MNEPLERLLARLWNGDMEAAGQIFVAYEPYLRTAVRRRLTPQLRTKFDSADIVQSVWADVLRRFREAGYRFADADQLRAFLFVAMRNRLIDRIRQQRLALEHEQPFGEKTAVNELPSALPLPCAVAQAEDLWEWLLAHCRPEDQAVLRLKRQGSSLAEIAAQTGFHPDSIRRILRLLARRLALR